MVSGRERSLQAPFPTTLRGRVWSSELCIYRDIRRRRRCVPTHHAPIISPSMAQGRRPPSSLARSTMGQGCTPPRERPAIPAKSSRLCPLRAGLPTRPSSGLGETQWDENIVTKAARSTPHRNKQGERERKKNDTPILCCIVYCRSCAIVEPMPDVPCVEWYARLFQTRAYRGLGFFANCDGTLDKGFDTTPLVVPQLRCQ